MLENLTNPNKPVLFNFLQLLLVHLPPAEVEHYLHLRAVFPAATKAHVIHLLPESYEGKFIL